MADLPRPVLARSSPAIRAGTLRRIVLILCGVLLAGALLVVFFNLEGPDEVEEAQAPDPREVEEYLPLPFDGVGAASPASGQDPEVIFESGAWIEVADAQGRLVQMYRAERLEPLAEGMIDLLEPVAVMFLSQGRVLTIEGNFCRAKRRSDNDVIESGRISGDVKIRMFEQAGNEPPKYVTAPPSLYIETEDAEFDNISGEIVCPGDVLVRTDTFEFFGRDLLARYDDENGLQYLRSEQTLRPIRIASTAVESVERPGGEAGIAEEAVESWWPRSRATQQDADGPPQRGAQDDRPRRRRDREAVDAEAAMQLYRATFETNVHVWLGHEEEALAPQVVIGDELRAVFTLEHSRLSEEEGTRVSTRSRSGLSWRETFGWRELVALSALAAIQEPGPPNRDAIMPPPSPDDLRISHDGPLTIVPIDDSHIVLANEDDVYLEIPGVPATLIDRDADSIGRCGLITYAAAADHAVLLGTAEAPLHFESPELIADGTRFEYGFSADQGAFVGPGTMQLFRREDDQGDTGGETGAAPLPALAMAWSDRVDLRMMPRPQDPVAPHETRLEEATFRGHVSATEERFAMKSDELRVDFDTQSAQRDQIEAIEARGAVDVQGLDARGGRMTSNELKIDFGLDQNGNRQATTMTALGDAHLEDPTQSIDAQRIIAHFVPVPVASDGAAASDPGQFGEVEVDVFEAEDSVRIALESGTRATGDRFIAKVRENVADLYGAPVVVDGGEDDVEFHAEGPHVHIERRADGRNELTMIDAGSGRITNHGAARGLETFAAVPDEVEAPEPAEAAEAAEAPQPARVETAAASPASPQVIDVTWAERLEYVEGDEVEPDLVELFGTVRASSTAALEDSSVESEYLRLDFADEQVEASEAAVAAEGEVEAAQDTRRVLKRMIAKGDAELESRSWLTPAREESGLRIVYVSGQHVEYDQGTMTVDVPGAGKLLILDQRAETVEAGAVAQPAPSSDDAGFAGLTGKGTTLFDWQGSMRMRQLEEGLFSMHIEDDVIMRHDSLLETEPNSFLTSRALDVSFGRRGPEEQAAALDFGGAMELRTFEASGAAHLDAMGKAIEASRILYDAYAQMAEIFGSRAAPAEIMAEGARVPQRAEKFIWDLRQDRVTIIRAAGGAGQ